MKKYIIKTWTDEVARDLGESDIIKSGIEDIKEAITMAKEVMEDNNFASLEVQDENEQETFYFCTPKEEEYFYDFETKTYEEKIKIVVDLYFLENRIYNLNDYGADRDGLAMLTLSDLYKELMDKLNIKYTNVLTDDISDGKYESVVEFENDYCVVVATSSWNNKDIIVDNLIDIHQEYERTKDIEEEIEI